MKGTRVTLIDSGRALGGRVCTQLPWDGRYSFDHGCQYLSPKGGPFQDLVDAMVAAGSAAAWGAERVGTASTSGSVINMDSWTLDFP